MNYASAYKTLGSKPHCRLPGVETELVSDESGIHVVYRGTKVLTFREYGFILNSGGFKTATTRARMNDYLEGWQVFQEQNVWYVRRLVGEQKNFVYADGMLLNHDGTVEGEGLGVDAIAAQKLTKNIRIYAKEFMRELLADRLPVSFNDHKCLYCMPSHGPDGNGFEKDTKHIKRHIKEKEFPTALIERTMEVFPGNVSIMASQVIRAYLEKYPDRSKYRDFEISIAIDQGAGALDKYLRRQLGLPS